MSARAAPRRARTGSARERAADVLLRVELDGAFAAPALDAALDRAPPLGHADRGLATELVYGVLRTAPALDARWSALAARADSAGRLDPWARAVIRIAAYEILALSRVPPRASVHAAVETLKRDRSAGLAGFANAVLRKLAATRPDPLPDDARLDLALGSVPSAVRAALARGLGSDADADAVLRASFARTPSTCVRVQPLRTTRDALAARLAAELPGARLTEGALSPLALHVTGGGDVTRAAAFAEGLFAVQEEGAQCVALATGAAPGMRVLDACAGRGGKTAAVAAMMHGRGLLHALELYPDRVARIEPELARLGLCSGDLAFTAAAVDLTRGWGALADASPREGYDVVLVDAPCTGYGTLAHRPEIMLRGDRPADDEDDAGNRAPLARGSLPETQRAIVERVATRVASGGLLLYAVCTLTRDEGAELWERFRAGHPEFEPAEAESTVPTRLRAAAVTLRPDRDGTDGFQLFRLRRTRG